MIDEVYNTPTYLRYFTGSYNPELWTDFEQECAECAKYYVFVDLIHICVPKVGKASLGLQHTYYWHRLHIDAVALMFEI